MRAVDVQNRAQGMGHACRPELGGRHLANAALQLGVPGGAAAQAHGEAGGARHERPRQGLHVKEGGNAEAALLHGVALQALGARSYVRSGLVPGAGQERDGADATREGVVQVGGVAVLGVGGLELGDLLLHGHAGKQVVRALLRRERGVAEGFV